VGIGGQGGAIQDLVHAGLATHDPGGILHPRLAEAVPSIENGLWRVSSDGSMETTWRIKPTATWHDGTPFTADDLVFTATVSRDPEVPYFGDVAFGFVQNVETIDRHTVLVKWTRPFIDADTLFSANLAAPLPRHILEAAYLESKASLADHPYWSRDFVGLGPFKVREMDPSSHLVVDAFDRYVLGRPRVDVVEVRFLTDETTLLANILAGAVELTIGRGMSAEQGAQLGRDWRDGRVEAAQNDWFILYPQFVNPSPPVVADVRLRRALLYATNRPQMAETLEGGMSSIVDTFVQPREPEYRDVESSIVRYAYDPRRGGQLIEEMGYTRGGDGVFRDSANQRLEVELNSSRADSFLKLIPALDDDWRRIGVGVAIDWVPPQRMRDAEYRANFRSFSLSGQSAHLTRFHSSEARLPERNYRGANNARYMNAEMDALIDRYFATVPKPERNRVLAQIVHHLTDQVVVLPLIWQVDPTMIGNRLTNVGAASRYTTQVWNAHEWDVR
jgi:peptide/nickel transport system substrate-binding protein